MLPLCGIGVKWPLRSLRAGPGRSVAGSTYPWWSLPSGQLGQPLRPWLTSTPLTSRLHVFAPHRSEPLDPDAATVNVIFKYHTGEEIRVAGKEGITILELAHANGIPIEGACDGFCSCSTCHVIVEDPSLFDSLPPPSEEEEDILDLAFGLTDTYVVGTPSL